MEPLPTTKRTLIWLSICRVDSGATSKWKKIAYILFPSMCLFITLCMVAACGAFIFKFRSINLADCIYSFMVATLFINSTYIMLTAFSSRQKISTIFVQLSEIYDALGEGGVFFFSFVSSKQNFINYFQTEFQIKILNR